MQWHIAVKVQGTMFNIEMLKLIHHSMIFVFIEKKRFLNFLVKKLMSYVSLVLKTAINLNQFFYHKTLTMP